jgi:L-alanine-DL-glutamate epimerase-like enolase superfamily enzyme
VTAHAAGCTGIGYPYGGPSVASVVSGKLADVVRGEDALLPAASWAAMQHVVRNLGKPGIAAEAISAVDIALWGLRARLLDESWSPS